jgi:predicted kinase
MVYYVVIRGPLGVGKSTVSQMLASRIGADYVPIDRNLEEHGLEEWDEDRISRKSFLQANAIAVKRARASLHRGTPVVFDGNFYWREVIDDLLQRLEFDHFVFTLQAPLSVCVERDRQRPMTPAGREPRVGDSLGAEATRDVYGLATRIGYGTPIDATGPVETTVTMILRHLPAGASR